MRLLFVGVNLDKHARSHVEGLEDVRFPYSESELLEYGQPSCRRLLICQPTHSLACFCLWVFFLLATDLPSPSLHPQRHWRLSQGHQATEPPRTFSSEAYQSLLTSIICRMLRYA